MPANINPLNAELNPICHLLALLEAHHILHVSKIRVKRQHSAAQAINWHSVFGLLFLQSILPLFTVRPSVGLYDTRLIVLQ